MSWGGFFDDIGSDLSGIGSGISSAVSGAANWLGNQFSGLFGGDNSSGAAPNGGGGPAASIPSFDYSNNTSSLFAPASGNAQLPMSDLTSSSVNPTSSLSYSGSGTNPDSVLYNTGPNSGTPQTGSQSTDSTQNILQQLGIGGKNSSPLGALVSGGGLLYDLAAGSPTSGAEKQIKNLAASQSAQGQQLESYINNGTLPPGAQQWVNNQTAAQQASIRAKYAQLGMSGSTAEAQELANVQSQATAQMFTIASQLLQSGISETGASGTLYNYLMNAENADQNQVSSAIQNFVTALGGGAAPGSINLKVG